MMFELLPCPHCEQPGISVWRKLGLGPALPTRCQACGEKVGVPWSTLLYVVPTVGIAGFTPLVLRLRGTSVEEALRSPGLLVEPLLGAWLGFVALWMLGFSVFYVKKVSLVKR